MIFCYVTKNKSETVQFSKKTKGNNNVRSSLFVLRKKKLSLLLKGQQRKQKWNTYIVCSFLPKAFAEHSTSFFSFSSFERGLPSSFRELLNLEKSKETNINGNKICKTKLLENERRKVGMNNEHKQVRSKTQ